MAKLILNIARLNWIQLRIFIKSFISLKKLFIFFFIFINLGCSQEHQILKSTLDLRDKISIINCLKNAPKNFALFFKNKGVDIDIEESWSCLEKTNNLLSRHIGGNLNSGKNYSRESFRKFINSNFLDKSGHSISEELFISVMEIKVLFLGGSVDVITKKELEHLNKGIINFLRRQFLIVTPYMKIYLYSCEEDNCSKFDEEEIEKSILALKKVANNFTNQIARTLSVFTFDQLEKLIYNFQENYDYDFQDAIDFIPSLAAIKAIFLGGKEKTLEPEEWKLFFDVGISALKTYVEYNHTPSHESESEIYNSKTHILFKQFFTYFRESLKRHPDEIIPYIYFENLIDRLVLLREKRDGVMDDPPPRNEIFKKTFRNLVDFILHPKNRESKKGFDKEALNYLYEQYRIFHNFHIYSHQNINRLCSGPLEDTPKDFYETIQCDVKLLFDDLGRFYVSQFEEDKYDSESIIFLNFYRAIFVFIRNAYSESSQEISNHELKKVVHDFIEILRYLEIFKKDESIKSKLSELYNISNLFLTNGDGDKSLKLSESVGLLHYVIGVRKASKYFLTEALENCSSSKKDKISQKCFERFFKKYSDKYLENFPHMKEYYDSLLETQGYEEEFQDYNESGEMENLKHSFIFSENRHLKGDLHNVTALENFEVLNFFEDITFKRNFSFSDCDRLRTERLKQACLESVHEATFSSMGIMGNNYSKTQFIKYLSQTIPRKKQDFIGESELSYAFSSLFFVELYYLLYDKESDGVIDLEEALSSYPRFRSAIRDISPFKGQHFVKSVFTFLIYKGQRPSFSNLFSFLWWYINDAQWKYRIQSERIDLIRTLSQL